MIFGPFGLPTNSGTTMLFLGSNNSGGPSYTQVGFSLLSGLISSSQFATYSIGGTGFVGFPSGLLIQWTQVTASTGGAFKAWPMAFSAFYSGAAVATNQIVALSFNAGAAGATVACTSGTPSCQIIGIGS